VAEMRNEIKKALVSHRFIENLQRNVGVDHSSITTCVDWRGVVQQSINWAIVTCQEELCRNWYANYINTYWSLLLFFLHISLVLVLFNW
jgi:hypothetical protein